MKKAVWFLVLLVVVTLTHPLSAGAASAGGLPAQAGPYQLEVSTDPSPIPTGPAEVWVHVTDSAGKDVTGAQVQVLTQMPGMAMGERTEQATPEPGQPGVYTAPANFQMAGGWPFRIASAPFVWWIVRPAKCAGRLSPRPTGC